MNFPVFLQLVFYFFKDKESFSNLDPHYKKSYPVSKSGVYTLDAITPGKYAILAFWDINNNNKLDRNFIGIPKEPTAFSNDYRPKGPPNFNKAAIIFDKNSPNTLQLSLSESKNNDRQFGIGIGGFCSAPKFKLHLSEHGPLCPVVGWPQTELPLDACSLLYAKMPPCFPVQHDAERLGDFLHRFTQPIQGVGLSFQATKERERRRL